ncbi:MAG: hypothetical protein V3V14_01225 [Saprospiraceae bacterium]
MLAIDKDINRISRNEKNGSIVESYCTSLSSAYDMDFMLILYTEKTGKVYSYFTDIIDMLFIRNLFIRSINHYSMKFDIEK